MANFTSIVTAAVGAVVISTAFVGAAVGPAATAGKAPAATYVAASIAPSSQAVRA
jgi:hypothetical protein